MPRIVTKQQRTIASLTRDLTLCPGQAIKDQVHSLLYYVLCSGGSPMMAGLGITTVTLAGAGAGAGKWSGSWASAPL